MIAKRQVAIHVFTVQPRGPKDGMWALILDCRGHVACAHGAHMHVSRGKSFSGVPVNRLLFTAERKTCPNWFSCKNPIIPFHLITCPLHRVQAPLLFSPQLSSPQHVMSFRLEYSKNRKKPHICWEQRVSHSFPKEMSNRFDTNICSLLVLICVLRTTEDCRSQRRGLITAWSISQSNCSLETFETEGRLD